MPAISLSLKGRIVSLFFFLQTRTFPSRKSIGYFRKLTPRRQAGQAFSIFSRWPSYHRPSKINLEANGMRWSRQSPLRRECRIQLIVAQRGGQTCPVGFDSFTWHLQLSSLGPTLLTPWQKRAFGAFSFPPESHWLSLFKVDDDDYLQISQSISPWDIRHYRKLLVLKSIGHGFSLMASMICEK